MKFDRLGNGDNRGYAMGGGGMTSNTKNSGGGFQGQTPIESNTNFVF